MRGVLVIEVHRVGVHCEISNPHVVGVRYGSTKLMFVQVSYLKVLVVPSFDSGAIQRRPPSVAADLAFLLSAGAQ